MCRGCSLFTEYSEEAAEEHKVARHAGVAAHKSVYSAADSGKHAESVIEGGVRL